MTRRTEVSTSAPRLGFVGMPGTGTMTRFKNRHWFKQDSPPRFSIIEAMAAVNLMHIRLGRIIKHIFAIIPDTKIHSSPRSTPLSELNIPLSRQ